MKSASFIVGQQLTLNEKYFEIIRILENETVQLESKSDFRLISRTKAELLHDHECGYLKFVACGNKDIIGDRSNHELPDLSTYNNDQQKIAQKRLEYLRHARRRLGNKPQWVGLDEIIQLVAIEIHDEDPPAQITVYKWWHRWENSLHDITSLIPRRKNQRAKSAFSKRVVTMLNTIIQEDYLKREAITVQDAYDRLKILIITENKKSSRIHKVPSRATVYRYFKNLDKYEVIRAQQGKRAAKKEFRVTGAGVYPDHILGRTEIDHTPLDLIVVDDETFLPIGRPNLTCIIDKASRALLGYSLDFEPPSELSVIRALRQALFSKANLKKTTPDIENEWMAYGIPMCLVVDNGLEFHSKMLRQLCYELNIELVFCPKQEPQFKGCIERILGSINRGVSHKCAGTTFSNIRERGDYPSEEQARITLKEANLIITQWIVDVYHQRRHSITGYTPDYLWKEGLANVEPRLPESTDAFTLASAKPYSRCVAHDGVRFKYLNYNSIDLQTIRRNPKFTGEVNIRINHEDLGFIWIHDQHNGEYIKVFCIEFEYANKLTLLQHEKILKEKRLRSDELYDEEKYLEETYEND